MTKAEAKDQLMQLVVSEVDRTFSNIGDDAVWDDYLADAIRYLDTQFDDPRNCYFDDSRNLREDD